MVIPETEAVHDSDGFIKDPRRPYDDTYTCNVGRCKRMATVKQEEFTCDEHWLFCHRCGTGLFIGIQYIYCPNCDYGSFARMR